MLACSSHVLKHCNALQIYVAKHAKEKKGEWVSGNLMFFRMHRISDIYFVGGFGTVQWVDVADYMATTPDSIVAADPQETISVSHTCTLQMLHATTGCLVSACCSNHAQYACYCKDIT